VRTDLVRVVFAVRELELVEIKPGRAAEVEFLARPGVVVAGKVARVGVTVDPATGTVRAEIDLPNPTGEIRPGTAGLVHEKLGRGPDGVRVPASAVVYLAGAEPGAPRTPAVYVYKGGTARLTPVRVGSQNGTEAEVASGLTTEDLVVIDPKGLVPKPEVTVEVEKGAPPK
jgi:multidrug efflux pump subunit AcrA (membrane-fusion protein)